MGAPLQMETCAESFFHCLLFLDFLQLKINTNVAYFGEAHLDPLQDYKNTNKNITTRIKLRDSEWKKIFVAHITTKELIQNKAYEKMLNLIHYHGYTS